VLQIHQNHHLGRKEEENEEKKKSHLSVQQLIDVIDVCETRDDGKRLSASNAHQTNIPAKKKTDENERTNKPKNFLTFLLLEDAKRPFRSLRRANRSESNSVASICSKTMNQQTFREILFFFFSPVFLPPFQNFVALNLLDNGVNIVGNAMIGRNVEGESVSSQLLQRQIELRIQLLGKGWNKRRKERRDQTGGLHHQMHAVGRGNQICLLQTPGRQRRQKAVCSSRH
jgi:hypothetical protein